MKQSKFTGSDLLRIREQSGLTHQELANYLGISKSTVYRLEAATNKPLPSSHQKSAEKLVVTQLLKDAIAVIEKRLISDGYRVHVVSDDLRDDELSVLAKLGSDCDVQRKALRASEYLRNNTRRLFQNLISQVQALVNVVHDPDLCVINKWVAFAALAYFVLPTDMIPDAIPLGFFDDLCICSLVTDYYNTLKSKKRRLP